MLSRSLALVTTLLLSGAAGVSAQAAGHRGGGSPSDSTAGPGRAGQMERGEMNHGGESEGASPMHQHMMQMMERMHGGDGGMGGGMGGEMGGGMGMGGSNAAGPGPERVLGMSEALGLAPDQVEELEGIRDRIAALREEHREAVAAAREEGRQALQAGTPDLDAYERALTRESERTVAMKLATARATVEARAVLTDSQRARLEEEMESGQMGGMMGGEGRTGGDGMMDGGGGHGAGSGGSGSQAGGGHGGGGGGHDH